MSRTLGITGVTGFIGSWLAEAAMAQGWSVRSFSRRAWRGRPHVPVADRRFHCLPAPPRVDDIDGIDVMVHLAVAPQGAPGAVVTAVNVDGTRHLYQACHTAGVSRFIFVSSQSAHAGATSGYARSKLATEAFLGDRGDVVVVRPGLVYGDGDEGLLGRAVALASRARFFPVVGGAAAQVQVIHVADLSVGLLRLAAMEHPPAEADLADPTPRPLASVIRQLAMARRGVRVRTIALPLGPATIAARATEALRVPLPFSSENLAGIASFRPIDTSATLATVDLELRSLGEPPAPPRTSRHDGLPEPRRLLILGAGRIGAVHALNALHHHAMTPVAVCDLDRKAMGRLLGVTGVRLPCYTSLDQALRAVVPDAAIVCTPPHTHPGLTARLLEAGVDALVEKPVAIDERSRSALRAAVSAHPSRLVSTGYVAAVMPQLTWAVERLRRGRFGSAARFEARAYVSRVTADGGRRRSMWELDPSKSGGGALINLAVHVLSMLDRLLGPLTVDQSVLTFGDGRETEDAAWLHLRAGEVPGELVTAWHLPVFTMPENHVRIVTDLGQLVVTTACAAFVPTVGEPEVFHQADDGSGFDLAPLDAGAGFWKEQDTLARRADGANQLDLAERVEGLIDRSYRIASRREVGGCPPPAAGTEAGPPWSTVGSHAGLIDVRGAPESVLQQLASDPSCCGGVVMAVPRRPLDRDLAESTTAVVVVPDVARLFRIATNEGPTALVRHLGPGPATVSVVGLHPRGVMARVTRDFEMLLALLRAELVALPRSFAGSLLVDGYMADLAAATGRVKEMGRALSALARRCPSARVGAETNAIDVFAPLAGIWRDQLDVMMALGSPRPGRLDVLGRLVAGAEPPVKMIVKVGLVPVEVGRWALAEPERWLQGNAQLASDWRSVFAAAWSAALDQAARSAGATGPLAPAQPSAPPGPGQPTETGPARHRDD